MTADEIIKKLKDDYPGKEIIRLPEDNPTEIICELEPTREHTEYSVAIAAINSSLPHYHKLATEEYEVLDGELELSIENTIVVLEKGENHTVNPGQLHSATGKFTLVRVTSKPGWTSDDHILSK